MALTPQEGGNNTSLSMAKSGGAVGYPPGDVRHGDSLTPSNVKSLGLAILGLVALALMLRAVR